jgi:hypothetical protein
LDLTGTKIIHPSECFATWWFSPRVCLTRQPSCDSNDLGVLVGQNIPWRLIGELDALEQLSLWNSGLGGAIDGTSLCRLANLRVIALRCDGKLP